MTQSSTTANLVVVDHPLIQHKLTLMRRKEKSTAEFRALLSEIALLLGYEAMKELRTELREIETPMCKTMQPVLAGKKLCFVSILRAGDGLLGAMLDLVPSARVGHVGMYRDEETLRPVEYLVKLPADLAKRRVITLDPMLATGNSAIAAIERVKQAGAQHVSFVCLLAAPEGIANLQKAHPDVPIITAAIDEGLNENGFIVPGLGDAGDRLFGTK
ncbi:MAG: uracil phosphoribosyltransferase [Robiginitomaculum sp.]|nr:MAG: uracil phosphoribosyltransferase [Robiginitomaculum sp.]